MAFKHYDLELVEPKFNSSLTQLIIDLDYLRKKPLIGTTHPKIFFQLKEVFHFLESWGSARIEGNRTTISEYIETRIENKKIVDEKSLEIKNVEEALIFIDKNIKDTKINRAFLDELHKIVVKGLTLPPDGEGSKKSGKYREENVKITNSQHIPPEHVSVPGYMDDFFGFINNEDATRYDLIKIAIAHHRFTWIHPYDNGNGRVVRLLTYAMLVKGGFRVDVGDRIINPTAIFCNDRKKYNEALAVADSGDAEDVLFWCEYVLSGLKVEIEKIDKLLDYSFLSKEILIPSINFALDRGIINEQESKILLIAIKKSVFQSSDLKEVLKDKIPASRSRILRELKNKKLIESEEKNSRRYVINFRNNYLLRGVINMLDHKGFLPSDNEEL